ncbi:hypothetical protein SK128_028488 [Halocaridina rubra]|uniref:Uncharacterized protein n=1 Tax=Halocaridina rubra TaxID=373956 RepID=A0AAN8WHB7_HALRR
MILAEKRIQFLEDFVNKLDPGGECFLKSGAPQLPENETQNLMKDSGNDYYDQTEWPGIPSDLNPAENNGAILTNRMKSKWIQERHVDRYSRDNLLVSLVQTLIFSWVLVETYQSYQSALDYRTSSTDANSSLEESSSSTYSFNSPGCPIGFIPLTTRGQANETEEEMTEEEEEDELQEEMDTSLSSALVSRLTSNSVILNTEDSDASTQASLLAMELTLEEEEIEGEENPTSFSSSTSALLSSAQDVLINEENKRLSSSTSAASPSASALATSSNINDSIVMLTSSSSSLAASSSDESLNSNSSTFNSEDSTKMKSIKCVAPVESRVKVGEEWRERRSEKGREVLKVNELYKKEKDCEYKASLRNVWNVVKEKVEEGVEEEWGCFKEVCRGSE